jgi:predicted RNA-binding Zn-ribbon protein involved in translation (DUF1610 family)
VVRIALSEPESMDECVYYTFRGIGDGEVKAWVFKQKCPKCGKGLMGKPRDEKGKVKIRAKHYVCPECGYTAEKDEYEKGLTANIKYICPHCKAEGETQVPFQRKKVQVFDEEEQKKKSIEVLRFQCGKCSKNIDITKKMK